MQELEIAAPDVAELRGKRVKIPCGPAAVSEEPKPMPHIAIAAATEKLFFGKAGRGDDARAGRPAFHIL